MLEQSHSEFSFKHPQDSTVQYLYISFPGTESFFQLIVKRNSLLKFHIHSGFHAHISGIRHRLSHMLHIIHIADSSVIRYADTVKPHFLPQKSVQDFFRSRRRLSVDQTVAWHDPSQGSIMDGCLERLAVHFVQKSGRCVRICSVDSCLRVMKGEEVLCS